MKTTQGKVSAIVLAAGSSVRVAASTPKQFLKINGKYLFEYSLEKFLNSPDINEVVLVLPRCHPQIKKFPRLKIAFGGLRRQDSVISGLEKISPQSKAVLIHDAARPYVRISDIKNLVESVLKYKAAICAIPCYDTVKFVRGGWISKTLRRENIFFAATPQGFSSRLIAGFVKKASSKKTYTDEAAVLEDMGVRVKIVPCEGLNMKITKKEDLKMAKMFLKKGVLL